MNARHWSLGLASLLLALLAWGCEGPKAENDHGHDHAHEAGDHDHTHDGDGGAHDHDGADHAGDHDAGSDHDHAHSSEEPSAERAVDYRKQASEARSEIAKLRARIERGSMNATETQSALQTLESLMEKSAELEAAAVRLEAAESDGHDH